MARQQQQQPQQGHIIDHRERMRRALLLRGSWPRLDRFFTWWALGAHGLFALGLLPDTTLLAALVLAGSEVVVKRAWRTPLQRGLHLALHYAPLCALVVAVPLMMGRRALDVELRLLPVLAVGAAYLAYHRCDVPRIVRIYKDIPGHVWSGDSLERP
jgi:hypothetical protein